MLPSCMTIGLRKSVRARRGQRMDCSGVQHQKGELQKLEHCTLVETRHQKSSKCCSKNIERLDRVHSLHLCSQSQDAAWTGKGFGRAPPVHLAWPDPNHAGGMVYFLSVEVCLEEVSYHTALGSTPFQMSPFSFSSQNQSHFCSLQKGKKKKIYANRRASSSDYITVAGTNTPRLYMQCTGSENRSSSRKGRVWVYCSKYPEERRNLSFHIGGH